MAEARSAALVLNNKRGFRLGLARDDDSFDITITIPHPRRVWTRFVRSVARTRNTIQNAVFPAPPMLMILVVAVVVGIVVTSDRHSWWRDGFLAHALWAMDERIGLVRLPLVVRVAILAAEAAVVGFFALMYFQRTLLRILFSYTGWLYQPPRTVPLRVKLWAFTVRLLSGRHPLMYSFQAALPRQSVPSVESTVSQVLGSVEPLLSEADMQQFKQEAATFTKQDARRLQWVLRAKSWVKSNYITDWWEKYVYHRGRDSIMINSNYYVMDSSRVSRAAALSCEFVKFKRSIDHESLEPMLIRGTVPLCMDQYRRMFSTTRLPGRDVDSLQQTSWSKHIAVLRRGHWFRVNMFDSRGTLLAAAQVEMMLQQVCDEADRLPEPSLEERQLPSLTAGKRQLWADVRETDFSEGTNLESLDHIERAMFVLVLEDGEPPQSWSDRGHSLLHGNGHNRWFDKTLTLVVYRNGRAGLNAEHSWADAPVVAHMWESCVANEAIAGNIYDDNGRCKPVSALPSAKCGTGRIRPPVALQWDLSDNARACIRQAHAEAGAAIQDLDLEVFGHFAYGKGFIKKCRVSPDAFIQMALQLAYFKDSGGKFALTYESSMTRLFLKGRTETVRTVSTASCKFVRAFSAAMAKSDGTAPPKKARAELFGLLRAAAAVHQKKYRDAMTGQGVDRHLFALYVVAKGRNMNCDFLNRSLSMPWRLSTSQQPQVQTNKWPPIIAAIDAGRVKWYNDDGSAIEGGPSSVNDVYSPGGGFGPVADDGYGVSYMVTGEDRIYFHVSSKRSSASTASKRFKEHVLSSFKDMHTMFHDMM